MSLNQIILMNLFFIKKESNKPTKADHESNAEGKKAHIDNGISSSPVVTKPVHSRKIIVMLHNGDSFHHVFVAYLEYLKHTAACFISFKGVSILRLFKCPLNQT